MVRFSLNMSHLVQQLNILNGVSFYSQFDVYLRDLCVLHFDMYCRDLCVLPLFATVWTRGVRSVSLCRSTALPLHFISIISLIPKIHIR